MNENLICLSVGPDPTCIQHYIGGALTFTTRENDSPPPARRSGHRAENHSDRLTPVTPTAPARRSCWHLDGTAPGTLWRLLRAPVPSAGHSMASVGCAVGRQRVTSSTGDGVGVSVAARIAAASSALSASGVPPSLSSGCIPPWSHRLRPPAVRLRSRLPVFHPALRGPDPLPPMRSFFL